MTDGRLKFKLGEHEYVALPQRIGYLQNRLGPRLAELTELAVDDGKSVVGKQAYELLSALIPKGFMPEHEFMGYATKDAYDAGDYDEELDSSPTVPEVFDAVKAVAKVNGGDAVDFLRQLLGGEMIGKLLALVIARMAETSGGSPNSQQLNGASAQTPSGTPAPTQPSA